MRSEIKTFPETPAFCYRIASMNVHSSFHLPALPASFDRPDVFIERGFVPESIYAPVEKGAWWQIGRDNTILIRRKGLSRILIHDSGRIVVDTDLSEPDGATLSFLIGPAFSIALIHRAKLLIHGATVAFGSRCALFIGPRESGKSTMAGLLRLKGYPNLGDDLCTIGFDGDTPVVEPVFPWLKLRSDTARFLDQENEVLCKSAHPINRVTVMPESNLGFEPKRLSAIYMLESMLMEDTQNVSQFPPISDGQAFSALYRNLYGGPIAKKFNVLPMVVLQLMNLNRIPMYRCPRAADLEERGHQADVIIEMMNASDHEK